MANSSQGKIVYRQAGPEDTWGMSELRKFFIDPSDGTRRSCEPKYYEWKLYNNPIHPGIAYIAEAGNKIVGMIAVSTRPMKVSCKSYLAGELGDGFVHPDYQRRGIFYSLLSTILPKVDKLGFVFTYGTPTAQAFSVEKKVGYIAVNTVHLKLYIRPLSLEKLFVRKKPNIITNSLGRFGQSIYDSFLLGKTNYLSTTIEKVSYENELIKKCYENSQCDVHANISNNYLSWRYDNNPDNYEIHTLKHDRFGDGFYIIKIGYSRGYRTGYVADYGYTYKSNMLKIIFSSALQRLRQLNVDIAATWAGSIPGDKKALISLGFIPTTSPFIIVRPGPNAPAKLSQSSWRFCIADSDNI